MARSCWLLSLASLFVALSAGANAPDARLHRVAAGESLWKIARDHRVEVAQLQLWNGLGTTARIRVGQELRVTAPRSASTLVPSGTSGAARSVSAATEAPRGLTPAAPRPTSTVVEPATLAEWQAQEADRRGLNPCAPGPDGWGDYEPWSQLGGGVRALIPKSVVLDRTGGFNLWIHFHGSDWARSQWVANMHGAVLVGIDWGIAPEAYGEPLQDPDLLASIVKEVEASLAKRARVTRAHVRRLGVSGWGPGAAAVGQLLTQESWRGRLDSVVALDGVYGRYDERGALVDESLEPWLWAARSASQGERLFFLSHSSLLPAGEPSTTESANRLLAELGLSPEAGDRRPGDPPGLELIASRSEKQLHVRGFAGGSLYDHCAQLKLLEPVWRLRVAPRWR